MHEYLSSHHRHLFVECMLVEPSVTLTYNIDTNDIQYKNLALICGIYLQFNRGQSA